MDPNIFEQEKAHLDETLVELNDAHNKLNTTLESMGAENLDKLNDLRSDIETNPHDFYMFMEQLHNKNVAFNFKDKYKRLEELESLIKEPYFSRIDLENQNESQSIYIGKFGFNDVTKRVVTDWRAKIASVYYRYRYPQNDVVYETPDGKVTTNLKLKRTYEIEDSELVKYYNNDLQLDENAIIKDKIKQRTGGVLEDIVETIQESQLDIIESDPRKICVVQGCVGSGKSTVAIHKLSHIFFNYPELINPERSILIAKNQILVGYLSTLFPKLGIFNINYGTVRDLIIRLIFKEGLKINFDMDQGQDTSTFKLKDLNKLNKKIDDFHNEFEEKIDDIFNKEEFISFGGFVYDKSISIHANLSELIDDLEEELKYQKESYENSSISPTRKLQHKANILSITKILRKLRSLRTRLMQTTFPKVVKSLGVNVDEKLGYLETLLYVLVYSEVIGIRNFQKYEYCVVDEGQDFSLLEYTILGKLVYKGRFCILGDLNQGYTQEAINDWKVIENAITDAKEANTFVLETNYRSTKQIIDIANSILSNHTTKYLPKSINRIGDDIKKEEYDNPENLVKSVILELKEDLDMEKSIGLICMNTFFYNKIEEALKDLEIEEDRLIVLNEDQKAHYSPKGLYLTRFEDCKGLEFSKTFVIGSTVGIKKSFNEDKRDFVAVTRAMNELSIYNYNGD